MYVPESLWPRVKEGLAETQKTLKQGAVTDFDVFLSAVIDRKSYDRVSGYVRSAAQGADGTKVVAGGKCDDSVGYFVEPTVVETPTPRAAIFREEIFGPVVTAYVYPDGQAASVLANVPTDTPYALTGAVFSQDQYVKLRIFNDFYSCSFAYDSFFHQGFRQRGRQGPEGLGRQLLRQRQVHRVRRRPAALRRRQALR